MRCYFPLPPGPGSHLVLILGKCLQQSFPFTFRHGATSIRLDISLLVSVRRPTILLQLFPLFDIFWGSQKDNCFLLDTFIEVFFFLSLLIYKVMFVCPYLIHIQYYIFLFPLFISIIQSYLM